jgi:hypothetical protein
VFSPLLSLMGSVNRLSLSGSVARCEAKSRMENMEMMKAENDNRQIFAFDIQRDSKLSRVRGGEGCVDHFTKIASAEHRVLAYIVSLEV